MQNFQVVSWLAMAFAAFPVLADEAGTSLTYAIPENGHVTIAINDAGGKRIRNLFADIEQKKGTHTAQWDGRDDAGQVAPPGEYRWVGLVRGSLHAVYRGQFSHGNPPWLYGKTGGWLADHYCPSAVVSYQDDVFIGSGVSEWGHGLVRCDLDGKKLWGVRWLNAAWFGVASMASDGERLFATSFPGWQTKGKYAQPCHGVWEVDPNTGRSWAVVQIPATIPADAKTGKPAVTAEPPFDKVGGLRVVGARKTGSTRWDGELYVSDVLGEKPRTFVYSTVRAPKANDTTGYYCGGNNQWYTMKLLRVLPVRIWDLTWLPDGRCLAALDRSLAVLDTATGKTTPFIAHGLEAPFAITSDREGRVYVSDRGGQKERDNPYADLRHAGLRTSPRSSMQVKIFDSTGRLLCTMGKAGGQGPGQITPQDFYLPGGLAVDARGRLWVSEENPTKRISVWSIPADLSKESPTLAREFFGPGSYGEGAYMTDPKHPQRITSGTHGIVWDVDIGRGIFKPVEMSPLTASPGQFSYQSYPANFPFGTDILESAGDSWLGFVHDSVTFHGRRYGWYSRPTSGYAVIGERKGPGDFRPLAAFGTVVNYIRRCGRYSDHWIPLPILEAAKRRPDWNKLAGAAHLDTEMTDFPHDLTLAETWPREINAFNWTDANGDGRIQAEEVTLSRLTAHHGANLFYVDRQLDALVSVYGNLYRMRPQGFNAIGAPLYDWTKAESCSHGAMGRPTYVGDDGSILLLPEGNELDPLRFLDPRGRLRWSYPARLSEHRHRELPNPRETLLQPGAIYGAWNMQGVVPGPGNLGPVFMLHGGHGMNYLLTCDDGLFIGTLFKPQSAGAPLWDDIPEARPGMLLEKYTLNDECFCGSIARAEASAGGFERGKYYLLGLGRRAVVELTGLDTVERLTGARILWGAAAAENARRRQIEAVAQKSATQFKEATTWNVTLAPAFGEGILWQGSSKVIQQRGRIGLWHSKTGLGVGASLCYCYRPGTPLSQVFVNHAPSWDAIFGYGDHVDLVIGGDPAADPNRTKTAAGDQRIVFAERNGTLEIVRYRRMPADSAPADARVLVAGRQGAMAWVADKLDLPNQGVTRSEPIPYNISASFHVTIPWKALGIDYQPGLKIRANAGAALEQPTGAGVSRKYWANDLGFASYDFATALETRPALWGTLVLRPAGYVFPPDVSAQETTPLGKPLLLSRATRAAASAAYADALTSVSADVKELKLTWYVTHDDTPFVNRGGDWTLLFKTGDGCDLQIASPRLGKCRYLITMYNDQSVVVRYRYDAKGAKPDAGVWYRSPAGAVFVPVVERLPLTPVVHRGDNWYTVEVALPWTVLGIEPHGGLRIPAELGVLRSDPTGGKTISRDYWHSGLSGMVMDVPTEVRPTERWGVFKIQ